MGIPPEGKVLTHAKATFAAGCFWGVEATFSQVEGVKATAVGYLGGSFNKPTYDDVCSGETGHAEVVQLEYDPAIVSYEDLLETFWSIHNPTTLNRQGPDEGTQYRSAIFFHTPEQQAAAMISKETVNRSGKYKTQVVTEISPVTEFFRAEEYHQRYFEKRGQLTCKS